MAKRIDINVDMGESFGRYKIGNDEEVMKYVSSTNIACGFHAGDPMVMRATVRLAKKYGVAVGAHPGLPDLAGFGRREIKITPDELRNYIVYQLGALKAFAEAEGLKLEHIKPHGTLYAMVERDEALAEAIIEGVRDVDPELIFITESEERSKAHVVAKRKGVRVARDAMVDLHYSQQGDWIIERVKKNWDPNVVAERALMVVKEGKIPAIDGTIIKMEAETLTMHGDPSNAPEVVRTVRKRLEEEGIEIVPLREVLKK
ncbi:5-oxoprolinase subunit PxpA [Candidatus Hecatella orcuttiae]|uniref:LamB/YcsF family protein n=1 Tax=Candidatus Hecatella orcuttiae TaxID=1935119 RepID=UPI002867C61E|nr:5-oxoprolinase subunit PxpA [Candidatus Hecatella orcuttiae]